MKNVISGLILISFICIPNFILGQIENMTSDEEKPKQDVSESITTKDKYAIFAVTSDVGVFFSRNEYLKEVYLSNSYLNWSVGTEFGNSKFPIMPWVKYSQYKTSLDSVLLGGVVPVEEILAKRSQISFGLIYSSRIRNNHFLQFKGGMSYNFFSETTEFIETEQWGFLMSIGYMRRFNNFISFYTDLTYDFAKAKKVSYLNDWSGPMISLGISVNLAAEN